VVTIEDATIAEGKLEFPSDIEQPITATDITLILGFTNISTTNGDYTTPVTVTFLAGATTATAVPYYGRYY
jgi:hypothetical protein